MEVSPILSLFWLSIYLLQVCVASDSTAYDTQRLHSSNRTVSHELFNSLEELARIVDVSYCVGSTGIYKPFECLSRCAEFENFELVTTWNTGPLLFDSCGYIALSHSPSEKRIIVAFRGTYSLSSTILDLSAYPQPYVPYTGDDNDDGDGHKVVRKCTNCTVHAGFMASWRTTRPFILDHLSAARAQYPDYKLVLAGHSLGGAVAELAGLEMRLEGWDPEVTTFGEPRVGNGAFAGFVDEVFDLYGTSAGEGSRFRRVTHVNDPVPLLPLEEWGYRMHAGEIFISKPRLPPSLSDVQLCEGDQDERCIANSEPTGATLDELKDLAVQDSSLERRGQVVLSDPQQDYPDDARPITSANWGLIPARYRLWELFFAHRDYFFRLGFCVPGGDPTG